jgi:hypothetical protein
MATFLIALRSAGLLISCQVEESNDIISEMAGKEEVALDGT